MLRPLLVLGSSLFAFVVWGQNPDAEDASKKGVPSGLIQLGTPDAYYSPFAFVVDKGARTIELWQYADTSYERVAIFPADIGDRDGDKHSLGDHRTPEGVYFLLNRLEGRRLDFQQYGSRAFVTDYPNFFDRRLKKTGSGIWLHAVPDEVSLNRGSRGCVVVRNDVIKEVTPYVKLGRTPILINSSVTYMDKERRSQKAQRLTKLLREWSEAWRQKDLESYMSFYSQGFRSMNMDRHQWQEYKKGLNEEYSSLHVRHARPVIYSHGERIFIRALQEYESDKYSDFGEKILYLEKEGDGYKIVGEEWTAIKSQSVREKFDKSLETTAVVDNKSFPSSDP